MPEVPILAPMIYMQFAQSQTPLMFPDAKYAFGHFVYFAID
ncbi:hypothetical protein BN2497_2937 [Janthinobacterium sp. CG23_2]|nr:hypothetical protein BN2497_2937 [Janthinobacterium sp. CG23_2]CUU27866.1 hypothetical protein BN3177_2937 [Janthinobacterium sp. CG23_2]